MAPNVTVPMNFGIEMLDSPTHSNLTLNTSVGVVKASSVILSFNSPVISHMTGTLHMTSVDMLEFGEQAVRLFVDAAYSGTSNGLTKELFRDVNKMSHVFEVNWLSSKCNEFFKGMCTAVKTANYDELCYLFEEASYLFKHLKITDYLEVVIEQVEQLTYKQQFLDQYLKGAERLSTSELDAVLLLAGEEVSFVIETITRQLTLQFKTQEPRLNHAEKYLLDNANLNHCKQSNNPVFNQLFDVLEEFQDLGMTKWVFRLYRKSDENMPLFRRSRCNIIPNLYHKIDFSLSIPDLLSWISSSDSISNSLMAVEAFETRYLYNENVMSNTLSISHIDGKKFCDVIKRRRWCELLPSSMDDISLSSSPVRFRSLGLTSEGAQSTNPSPYINIPCVDFCYEPFSLLSQDARLRFYFKNPLNENCSLSGKCGFILKTVPSNGGLRQLELCTKKEDYCNESIHFHEDVRAEDMHVYFLQEYMMDSKYLYPLSWLDFLHSTNNSETKDKYISNERFHRGSRFCVLYKACKESS